MSIEALIEGLDGLRGFIEDVKERLVGREVLDAMAAEAKRRVLERTAAGRDIHGAPFRPYSKAYRRARGRRGLSGRRVDLKSTGEMLKDISAWASADRGASTVSFTGGRGALKAGFHLRGPAAREFFGIDGAGKEAIERMLEEHIDEVIKDAH